MKTDASEYQLPHYDSPPLVEVVLGVQFNQLPGFRNAHLGAFWKTLDANEWATVSDAPPLQPQFERFTPAARWGLGLQLHLTEDSSSRLQIHSRHRDRMIQVQNGHLHFNWLGQEGGSYPRYRDVRDGFTWVLERFLEFIGGIGGNGADDFQPNQWEVTYLNHIPKGTIWETARDWDFFRLLGRVPTLEQLVEPESFSGVWHFVIPTQRGRLHIHWQAGVKSGPDSKEVVALTLTARGPVEEGTAKVQAVLAGLDLGQKTIVCSFEKLMTVEANRYWGLTYANE